MVYLTGIRMNGKEMLNVLEDDKSVSFSLSKVPNFKKELKEEVFVPIAMDHDEAQVISRKLGREIKTSDKKDVKLTKGDILYIAKRQEKRIGDILSTFNLSCGPLNNKKINLMSVYKMTVH